VSQDQIVVCALLVGALVLFAWGRWRHDVVAFAALMVAVVAGVVPFEDSFSGFGHPATITVALVLILSRGLANSGVTDLVARRVMTATGRVWSHILSLGGVGSLMSALMNNVGALALLMPVAMQSAVKAERSPSLILMPLSFATILGGLLTLIGTPPNIIVATYRADALGEPFSMFDFTPVGGVCALIGVLFVAFVGWRLLPEDKRRAGPPEEFFQIADYVTEARIKDDAKAAGMTLAEIEEATDDIDAVIIGLIRDERHRPAPPPAQRLRAGDVLVIEASPDDLEKFIAKLELEIVGAEEAREGGLAADDVEVVEAVVAPRSPIEGRTIGSEYLRRRFGVNLLAISREGRPRRGRLRGFQPAPGDVLLLQGEREHLGEVFRALGCLPLAGRGVQFGQRGRAGLAIGLFGAAIGLATAGVLSLQIAFGLAAVGMVLGNLIAPRELYDAIDWPVIVLLGAMLPLGGALESTGTTGLIADAITARAASISPIVVLVLLLVLTMTLSDVLNNAATVVVMAPIAVSIARELGVDADAFLMAVAIGGSSAFLTPIGHQNNTLVMGPGGYAFGDYWRMGLPLEVLIVAVATPMILLVWPL